jgi:hypothetical protein
VLALLGCVVALCAFLAASIGRDTKSLDTSKTTTRTLGTSWLKWIAWLTALGTRAIFDTRHTRTTRLLIAASLRQLATNRLADTNLVLAGVRRHTVIVITTTWVGRDASTGSVLVGWDAVFAEGLLIGVLDRGTSIPRLANGIGSRAIVATTTTIDCCDAKVLVTKTIEVTLARHTSLRIRCTNRKHPTVVADGFFVGIFDTFATRLIGIQITQPLLVIIFDIPLAGGSDVFGIVHRRIGHFGVAQSQDVPQLVRQCRLQIRHPC